MLDEDEQRVVDDIASYGFHMVGVTEDEEGPAFQYSVGFGEALQSPDVIVFGLKHDVMGGMIWEVFRQIKAGASLSDGRKWSDLIDGHDCISRLVHASQLREYFGYGLWYDRYRKREPLSRGAYQIVWPGKHQGLFPWERGCVREVGDRQPLLYLPRDVGLA
jgi:hypothetical protein